MDSGKRRERGRVEKYEFKVINQRSRGFVPVFIIMDIKFLLYFQFNSFRLLFIRNSTCNYMFI